MEKDIAEFVQRMALKYHLTAHEMIAKILEWIATHCDWNTNQ